METENFNSPLLRIDWNEEWKSATANSSIHKRRNDMSDFWNKKAARYSNFDNMAESRAIQVIDRMGIDSDTTVLDIGCGPGNLSIPLARKAGKVTALDPAYRMLEVLMENAEHEGLSNITCLNKTWEDIQLGREIMSHDVVVASYSLVMEDIGSALRKMDDAAKRGVCLFWFVDRKSGMYNVVWPKLFGEEYTPGPNYIYLLNILYQLGMYANVEICNPVHEQHFTSLNDAVDNYRENLHNLTPDQVHTLKRHLEDSLIKKDGGFLSRDVMPTALIWWKSRSKR